MSAPPAVVLEMTRVEGLHLAAIVMQFAGLLSADPTQSIGESLDPALARLMPDAYPDDADASREFRNVTQRDLLDRRGHDVGVVLRGLPADDADIASLSETEALEPVTVALDAEALAAWLRTLAAVRLVLASRLGIEGEDDHDAEDPRFGIYDWLGYRLEGLLQAADPDRRPTTTGP